MTAKKSTKTGKNFRGGGGIIFWLARIYTPEKTLNIWKGTMPLVGMWDAEI